MFPGEMRVSDFIASTEYQQVPVQSTPAAPFAQLRRPHTCFRGEMPRHGQVRAMTKGKEVS